MPGSTTTRVLAAELGLLQRHAGYWRESGSAYTTIVALNWTDTSIRGPMENERSQTAQSACDQLGDGMRRAIGPSPKRSVQRSSWALTSATVHVWTSTKEQRTRNSRSTLFHQPISFDSYGATKRTRSG